MFTISEIMAPKRSLAQKKQLVAMSAQRRQEGGSGTFISVPDSVEIQRAKDAQNAAECALEKAQAQLHAEHAHVKNLYHDLRMERQKVGRAKEAKEKAEANVAEAQDGLEQLQAKFEDLTLKNEELEITMSKLLERWAKEKEIAAGTMQELRMKVKALQQKCRRAPDVFKKALERSQAEGQSFSLMKKGVYSEEARELCQVLINAGCAEKFVGDVIEEILHVAGISVVGPTMSRRTVGQVVLEGGVMADLQMSHEIAKTGTLTVSSDSTTHRNIGYDARHINLPVHLHQNNDEHAIKHRSRLVGINSAPNHSSQTQAEGWQSIMQEKLDLYNQSPLAKRSQYTLKLADFFARLQGMNSDHAKDQKKLAALLHEIKETLMYESLGEEKLIEMGIPNMLDLLAKANEQKINRVGGLLKWSAMSDEEKLRADADTMSSVILKLGHEAYADLSEDERHKADFFIWAGCAMHKDLNCVKGGNEEMIAWWDENKVPGPILLANKDNAAVLEQVEDADEYTAVEQQAYNTSSGGGVKLTSLAGMLFNNKDDKIGQQDMHQQFFLYKGIEMKRFPDTSNNRYQAHCTAAAELLTNLELYREFMEWIRNVKERPGFTNMQKNIYNGLQDPATLTELAVLALYAQGISHPYMRYVRGPGTEHINMLDLGPLHFKIQSHMEKIIANPDLLLPPHGSYISGTVDGEPWKDPQAMDAIYRLSPSLPYLKPVLVAFFRGALRTWKRFTSEFQEGGEIDQTTSEEKDRAWMPPTNDVNEGALGALRSYLRKKPNATLHKYNALAMFKFNDTKAFAQHVFVAEDHTYVRQEARKRDCSHLERDRKAAIIASKTEQIVERQEKAAVKEQQKAEEEARLKMIKPIENVEDVTVDMTVAKLRDQLEVYRTLVNDIPLKSHLKTKAQMIGALKEAIRKYHKN